MEQTCIARWRDNSGWLVCRVLVPVLICVFLALLLELGTLIGAPLLTPLNSDHWRLKRMFIFFVACLCIYACWLLVHDERMIGPVGYVRERWRGSSVRERALGIAIASACIPTLLSLLARAATSLVGEGYDLRLPLIVSVCALVVGFLVLFRGTITRRLEYGFLVLALSFGMLMCCCMPVIAEVSWDGQIHFESTQAISYVLDAEYSNADLVMTRSDAVLVLDLMEEGGSLSGSWHPRQDASAVAAAQNMLIELGRGDVSEVAGTSLWSGGTWVSSAAVGRLPAAVGLWVGRLLQLSCLGQYFLARLFSMTMYVLVIFFAMRRLRSGKSIVAALGLLPTPLLMSANFSYDPWCFALIVLSFARYVSVLQRGEVFRRCDVFAIYGAFLLGALVKAVVFPLLLVFFVAPRQYFSSRAEGWVFRIGAVLTALCLLASFAIPFVLSGATNASDLRGGNGVDSAGQVGFILSNPISYCGVLVRFALEFLNPFVFSSEPNSLMNALSSFPFLAPSRPLLGLVEWGTLAFAAVCDRDTSDRTYRGFASKMSVVLGVIGSFVLIATALYVSFTPVGLQTVNGVQHRYLLPLLVPILLVFSNFADSPLRRRERYACYFLSVEWAVLTFVMATMFVVAF